MYEGGIRTPLIAWWPGRVAAGGETDHVSAFWDFVPTACELAETAAPADTDGISYVPTLLGRPADQRQHDHLYWEFYEQGGKQAVRQGDWKAVRLNALAPEEAVVELYDLSTDLHEDHNIAAENRDVVAHMRRLMDEAHVDSELFAIP
jgi:arylsulfatase A-like enzyme